MIKSSEMGFQSVNFELNVFIRPFWGYPVYLYIIHIIGTTADFVVVLKFVLPFVIPFKQLLILLNPD